MANLPYNVPAPPAQPPRYGLIAAAPTIDDPNWRPGTFGFMPEQCGSGGRIAIDCPGGTDSIDVDMNPGLEQGDPFVAWAGYECSPKALTQRDFEGRARRQLAAIESYEIANELWTGTLRDAEGWSTNHALVDSVAITVTSGAVSVTKALGCVEQELGTLMRGGRGMIHIPPQLMAHFLNAYLMTYEGGLWLSPMRHIIVADAGYEGTGPTENGEPQDTHMWIYGTSMIQVRLGPVMVVPATMAEAMDRSNNTVRFVAERPVAYEWDYCAHVAAETDVDPCELGGGPV